MNSYHLKQKLISCALLLSYLVDVSRGQKSLADFSSGSPSTCGSVKTLNVDDVFFISDILSSEGRSKKAYYDKSKGKKYYGRSDSYEGSSSEYLSHHSFNDKGSLGFPSKLQSQYETSSNHQFSPSFKNDQYSNKLAGMFPRLENEFGKPSGYKDKKKPEEFYNFMQNKFTRTYKNERRRFPEQPSRIGTAPPKKPAKKDILSGLNGKRVGKKKSSNASHADHKDTQSKLPVYVQHILDTNNKDSEVTTPASEMKVQREFHRSEYPQPGFPERRSMPQVGRSMGPRSEGLSPLMDILGNLGPDKVQKLRQYLGAMGNDESVDAMRNSRREYVEARIAGSQGKRGGRYGGYERSSEGEGEDDEGRHRSQTYNLDEYVEPGKRLNIGGGMAKRRHYSVDDVMKRDSRSESPHDEHETYRGSMEYHGDREIQDAVPVKAKVAQRRIRRVKRDAFPKPLSRKEDYDDTKSCRWMFKKGRDCRKLVVRIQYWIDGVRDCSKEYLLIGGSGHNDGDRICGGQENLRPYIVEEEKVSIEHFRETLAGPGATKFRGTIQCEQE